MHPVLLDAIELVKNRINSLPDVKSLCFDPKSREIKSNLNKEELFIINEFYQSKGFRKIHLEVAKLGSSFQILHCVFFCMVFGEVCVAVFVTSYKRFIAYI